MWIKDSVDEKINIINASKIDNRYLIGASITELDKNFSVIRHIQSEKIEISNKDWVVTNPSVYKGNIKNTEMSIKFYSNFDYERIQSLFSNLSSFQY